MKICIVYRKKSENDQSKVLLEKACKKFGVEYVLVAIEDFNFAQPPVTLEPGDAFYRVANGEKAALVERFLLSQADNITTLYKNTEDAFFAPDEMSIYDYKKLKTPLTLPLTSDKDELLQEAAEKLGGYPIIVKQLGRSHGVGVQKIGNFSELKTAATTLIAEKFPVVLKKYIAHKKHARLIVLGNTVIASISYIAPEDDFRTNTGTPLVQPETFSEEIESLAIEAVHATRREFGGVDILLEDGTDNFYLAEVNFPCFFPRAEKATGIPVSEYIVSYLQEKSKNSSL